MLRSHPAEQLSDAGTLIPPPPDDFIGPPMPPRPALAVDLPAPAVPVPEAPAPNADRAPAATD